MSSHPGTARPEALLFALGVTLLAIAIMLRPEFPTARVIICSTASADARPTSVVTILQSDAIGDGSDRRMTTLLVHFPGRARTPRHVHGGALTAYVLSGRLRSQLDAGPVLELGRGGTFHEAVGTVHTLIENPDDGPADVLATIVHAPGAPLTTLMP